MGAYGKLSYEHITVVWELTGRCRMSANRVNGGLQEVVVRTYNGCMGAYGKMSDVRKSGEWELTGSYRMSANRLRVYLYKYI
jgi:hypothetical protein